MESPKVTIEEVKSFISSTAYRRMGEKSTVGIAILKNGFEIVVSSSCVSADNYNEAIGQEICEKRIHDKVWELLGFLLQQTLYENMVDSVETLKAEVGAEVIDG